MILNGTNLCPHSHKMAPVCACRDDEVVPDCTYSDKVAPVCAFRYILNTSTVLTPFVS